MATVVRKTIPTSSRNTASRPCVFFSQPIAGSCNIGPIDPNPLITPAASAAWRRLPTSMAQAPESSESGPIEADYLVVGAGAMGMAFTDALIDHADVRVALVDRRHGSGGHWLHAYPFVRLHQSSTFYGVASTLLGGGRIQEHGPEAGLHERADQPTICAYYDRLLSDRMIASGRVEFHAGCDYLGDRTFVHLESGQRFEVPRDAGSWTLATSPPTSRRRHPRGSR